MFRGLFGLPAVHFRLMRDADPEDPETPMNESQTSVHDLHRKSYNVASG